MENRLKDKTKKGKHRKGGFADHNTKRISEMFVKQD